MYLNRISQYVTTCETSRRIVRVTNTILWVLRKKTIGSLFIFKLLDGQNPLSRVTLKLKHFWLLVSILEKHYFLCFIPIHELWS